MVKPSQRTTSFCKVVFGIVDLTTVVTGYQEEANDLRRIGFQYFPYGEKVAKRLGHLFLIHSDGACVHPGIHKPVPGGALGLSNFVFVVGKHQVGPATMNIKGITETVCRHGRALNMPTRPTITPRRRPAYFTLTGCFPQRKIRWAALGFLNINARARQQVFEFFLAEFSVV